MTAKSQASESRVLSTADPHIGGAVWTGTLEKSVGVGLFFFFLKKKKKKRTEPSSLGGFAEDVGCCVSLRFQSPALGQDRCVVAEAVEDLASGAIV